MPHQHLPGALPAPVPRDRRARTAFRAGLIAATASKLWLDGALRVKAETLQTFDDALYVRLARSILAGEWLGPYDALTLTKNPLYPLFLAFIHVVRVPLLLTQSALYAGAGLLLVRELRKLGARRAPVAVLYVVYLLNPFVEVRVLREGIYSSLLVLVLAALLALHRGVIAGRRSLGAAVAVGVALACVWLTREEGVLVVPSVALVVATIGIAVARRSPPGDRARRTAAAIVVAGALPFALVAAAVAGVALANYRWYGVFRLNEQGAPPFTAAFGALLRVQGVRPTPYSLVPSAVRRAVYRASPTFSALEPFLDGTRGSWALRRGWIADTCVLYPATCPDLAGMWTMWAFRQAAADAGMHGDPRVADRFYGRIAAEVDAACRSGALRCDPARSSVIPVLGTRDLAAFASALVTGTRVTLSVPIRDYVYDPRGRSTASAAGLAEFADLTGSEVLPAVGVSDGAPGAVRLAALGGIAAVYRLLLRWGVLAGTVAFVVAAVQALRRRVLPPLLLLAATAGVAAAVRLVALAYIDACMFPAFTLWPSYVTPLYPLLIVFAGASLLAAEPT